MKDFKTFARVRIKAYWDRITEYHKKHEKDLLLVLEDYKVYRKKPYFGVHDNLFRFDILYPTMQYFWCSETGFWYSNNLEYLGIIPESYNFKPNAIFLTELQYEILKNYYITSSPNLEKIKGNISDIDNILLNL